MCTVSYIPVSDSKVVLTSNRDELWIRPTTPPIEEIVSGKSVYFPKDMQAGGTWIAIGQKGRVCCLLNGAFEAHERKESYAKSRGKVVLEAFEYDDINDFFKHVNLSNTEPFTLIVLEHINGYKLYEFRWDGNNKYTKELKNDVPHIWSSATLYTPEVRSERENRFSKWHQRRELTDSESIFKFHTYSDVEDPKKSILMKTSFGLQTVSITQLELFRDKFNMRYNDLVSDKTSTLSHLLSQ